MSDTSHEVSLYEVMEWAQVQTKYLRPSVSLVLWYLTINAFRHDRNPEGAPAGQVMGARSSVAAIQRGTGLSNSGVRQFLQELQDQGYIIADMVPGRGQSTILIFWGAPADDMREDFRQGIKELPKPFRRKVTEKPVAKAVDAVVLQFPIRMGTN